MWAYSPFGSPSSPKGSLAHLKILSRHQTLKTISSSARSVSPSVRRPSILSSSTRGGALESQSLWPSVSLVLWQGSALLTTTRSHADWHSPAMSWSRFSSWKTSPPPPLLSSFMEVSLKQIICGKKKNERWHCQEILSSAAGPLCAVILLFFYYCYNLHWIFTVKCPCKFFQKTNILRTELNGLTRLLSPPCFFCLRKVLIYPSFMANKS